jgi:hypothetical protein
VNVNLRVVPVAKALVSPWIVIDATYRERDMMKSIPGARWVHQAQEW